MILRRFISNIKDRDWGSVVAELLVVVVGVFFGIQAANWNADRLEQEEGRLITERLLVDLRKDLVSRQMLVSYYEAVFEAAERTETRLNAESVDDPFAFVIDAYRATELAYRPATRATYDEIVSTGSLGLIPSEARQAGFADYFRNDYSYLAREAFRASAYRHRVRRSLPYDIQAAIREKCSDLRNERFEIIGFDNDCDLGISVEKMDEAAEALRSDPEILRDLRFHFSELNGTPPNFRGEVVILKASIKALENAN
jgi:hypothetical protein